MKALNLIIIFLTILIVSSCSGGARNPMTPSDGQSSEIAAPAKGSDVLYSYASRDLMAYKAFGIYQVVLDPLALTAEIIPIRKVQAIGTTFDADLTQFLTIAPCGNCLQVDGIQLLNATQVKVGFSIKHPFSDITKRPDLHGFDVRGIIIAKGNYNFPQVMVSLGQTSFAPVRANTTIVANADGWTHHFDELASDPNYFDPPRVYDASINPFRRYFVNPSTGAFDPHNPSGHNVMKTGSPWETQDFIFNMPGGGDPIDFVFISDIAYGQSAILKNRQTPYYFLPEFNRKEAWKVDVSIVANNLKSQTPSSSASIKVEVCDWQAGLAADPDYPDTGNLGGISAESDVASVAVYIPGVCNLIQKTNSTSGNGSAASPYVYDLMVTNSGNARASDYYGLVVVHDDLFGKQGPIAVPEGLEGLPYPGPDIFDYAVYKVFPIRVYGSPPVIDPIAAPASVYEGEVIHFWADIFEPDGDDVEYSWSQVSPANPQGRFEDAEVEDAVWEAPRVDDVPLTGLDFKLKLTVSDPDGSNEREVQFKVLDKNSPPVCYGIDRDPYWGLANMNHECEFVANASDPDGDTLIFEWDFSYDGMTFNQEDVGQTIHHTWSEGGFYTVACRISEDRPYPNQIICTTHMMIEGQVVNTVKIDDSLEDNPRFVIQDMKLINGAYNVIYQDLDNLSIYYCRNTDQGGDFFLHQQIFDGSTYDSIKDVRLAGFGNTINVIWIAHQPMHLNTDLMVVTSTNNGVSFDAFGGPRIINSDIPPNYIDHVALCSGNVAQDFYFLYAIHIGSGPSVFACSDMVSHNDGETWTDPPGDVISSNSTAPYGNPTFLMSGDGTLHAFWYDEATSPRYLYDWSTNGGTTWHAADQIISDPAMTVDPEFAVMAVTFTKPHFVWTELSTKKIFYRNLISHVPFNLGDIVTVRSINTNMRGIDMYVSPTGKTVMIPCTYWTNNPVFMNLVGIYYSFDSGEEFTLSDMALNTDNTQGFYQFHCDGRFSNDPDRVELFGAWTQGGAAEGHLYGGYYYLAERF